MRWRDKGYLFAALTKRAGGELGLDPEENGVSETESF